ncbi:unnamed protein product, partial [Closterium sp. NIES-54]
STGRCGSAARRSYQGRGWGRAGVGPGQFRSRAGAGPGQFRSRARAGPGQSRAGPG